MGYKVLTAAFSSLINWLELLTQLRKIVTCIYSSLKEIIKGKDE